MPVFSLLAKASGRAFTWLSTHFVTSIYPLDYAKSLNSKPPIASQPENISDARNKEIDLEGLSIQDAELIQAAMAPAELMQKWLDAPQADRPFLIAKWITEGTVQRIKFEPGRRSETPGFSYMRMGRELLLENVDQGIKTIKMSFVLDPEVAPSGLTMWLMCYLNPDQNEKARKLFSNPMFVKFINEEYGPETMVALIKDNTKYASKTRISP